MRTHFAKARWCSTRAVCIGAITALSISSVDSSSWAGDDPPGCTKVITTQTIGPTGPVQIGDSICYFVEYAVEDGSCAVSDIEIRFFRPDDPPDTGDPCTASNGVVLASGLTLNPGQSVFFDCSTNSELKYFVSEDDIINCPNPVVTARACLTGNGETGPFIDPVALSQTLTKFVVLKPQIDVLKEADVSRVCEGANTPVTYFYTVTNPGDVCLGNVMVVDDTCGPLAFTGGDVGGDGILCPGEIWSYECVANISGETTNTVTATGTPVVNGVVCGDPVNDKDMLTITANPPPTCAVDPPFAEICEGDPGVQFCVVPSGGRPPYTYSWTGPGGFTASTECITATVAGMYCATVTDSNGCVTQQPCCATLEVNEQPTVEVVRPKAENCEGDPPQEFCAVVSGGRPPYSYSWTGPNGFTADTQCISVENLPGNAGNYCVVVTDDNGCTGEACGSLVVNPARMVSITPPSAQICEGASQQFCAVATGGRPPYTYLWSNGATTECITVTEPGEYCVTVTDSNGCVDQDCAMLIIDGNPMCSVDPPSADICEGDPAVEFCAIPSGGTPPFSYEWTGPNGFTANTECISVSTGGKYCVTIIDANGCESAPCCGTLTVHENPSCVITATPPVGDPCPIELCADVTGGRPPFSYLWSTGETTACITVSPASPTVYSVTVTDDNGCMTSCDILVECPVGGEGCTPGYWKQPHHFDDWPEGFHPDDLFSATCVNGLCFEDAFPGLTLLEVLSQPASSPPGPNQLNSLGRHTVAALLNASSPDVDFEFTAQAVIAMFNDVYPGTIDDYRALKDILQMANEAGCPLNNSDFNGDSQTDAMDLALLLANWGGTIIGDVNDDGIVDATDLALLLSEWTPTP